jgi:predicted cupin superfamily sugar epimerase
MVKNEVQYWIDKLGLEPHPEGGYFKSTYAAGEEVGNRKLFTSIYFLLTSDNVSHFHRLKSDELWYFHAGSSLTVHVIHENGQYEEVKVGLKDGEAPQYLVPKNSIFGSSVMEEDAYALVGCMVSPGFDYEDFELFTQSELLEKYPQHKDVILKLAYEKLL